MYAFAEQTDKVIKYQVNCHTIHAIHPLLHDMWFLIEFKDAGIEPKLHYVSHAAKLSLSER